MSLSVPPLAGASVEDEIQLGGRRHLFIAVNDAGGAWSALLRCIIDAEHVLQEADLTLEGPEVQWSAALDRPAPGASTDPMRVRARFTDPDSGALSVEILEDESGFFQIQITSE